MNKSMPINVTAKKSITIIKDSPKSKPIQGETDNLNKFVVIIELIKYFPRKKAPASDVFNEESCYIFKDKILIFHNFLQKIEEKTLPNSLYENSIILIITTDKVL